jgi:hypothetical protein
VLGGAVRGETRGVAWHPIELKKALDNGRHMVYHVQHHDYGGGKNGENENWRRA